MAERYARLIGENRWSDVDATWLYELLRLLSRAAGRNLDAPGPVRSDPSAKEAQIALKRLFAATARPSGRPRSRRKHEEPMLLRLEQIIVSSFGVDGAPDSSLAEYRAWEAMELLRARERARRSGKSAFDEFEAAISPRLTYWKKFDKAEGCLMADRLVRQMYRDAVALVHAAGAPTERAVRSFLNLTYRAHRRVSRLRARP